MIAIAFIAGMVLGGIIGGLYMSSRTACKCEEIRKQDMRLAQRLIDDQYKYGYSKGYKDGLVSIYTKKQCDVSEVE